MVQHEVVMHFEAEVRGLSTSPSKNQACCDHSPGRQRGSTCSCNQMGPGRQVERNDVGERLRCDRRGTGHDRLPAATSSTAARLSASLACR